MQSLVKYAETMCSRHLTVMNCENGVEMADKNLNIPENFPFHKQWKVV